MFGSYRDQAAREVHRPDGRGWSSRPLVKRVVCHVVREHDEKHEQKPEAEPLPRRDAAVGQLVQDVEVLAGGRAAKEIPRTCSVFKRNPSIDKNSLRGRVIL